jgi:4-hydroxy-tetrahydrodipicolinate synthase
MTSKFMYPKPMFKGSIVALVTPFTQRGEIDFKSVDRLVDFHLENGTDGLVVAGTTGESATLSRQEFSSLLSRVIEKCESRIPVLAGTGSASTHAAVEQTLTAGKLGADGALIVTPYYNKPTQAGLKAHFLTIADASGIPIVLYNVPSRTAVDLLPSTVVPLSAHDRIVGIKEAVPDPTRITELCSRCQSDFIVLSGDDHSCFESMRHGAQGVISVAANVAPKSMHELFAASARKDWDSASEANARLKTLFDVLMIETNPIPVKWALFEMGLIESKIRLPLTQLDEQFTATVRQCLVEQELLKA